jgi:hypothetical protein
MPAGWIVKVAAGNEPVETDWAESVAVRISGRSEALYAVSMKYRGRHSQLFQELSDSDVRRLGLTPGEIRRLGP